MKNSFACLMVSALLATVTTAQGQTYPTKPIRVITANSAGGTSDIFVRALGDELRKRLGQPIIIENRSGGGMNIAGRACADAASYPGFWVTRRSGGAGCRHFDDLDAVLESDTCDDLGQVICTFESSPC